MISSISAILKLLKSKYRFMKKVIWLYRFQPLFVFTVFYLLTVQLSFAQDCNTMAANKPSVLGKSPDLFTAAMSDYKKPVGWNITKMKPNLTVAENWITKILAGFTGAKLGYENSYVLDRLGFNDFTESFFKTTGINGFYSGKMRFWAYYCYDNKGTIHTEGESGSNVHVKFNNIYAFGFTESEGVYTINGKPAFKVLKKKKTEGKIDYYEYRSKMNATGKIYTSNDYIILRNSDKPIFIAFTRKEYLQQMLKDVDIAENNNSKFFNEAYESNKRMFELEMKVYKENDKSYTVEKEAKRRKWFEEDQEKLKKVNSKINPDAIAAKEVISQYLQNSRMVE